MHFLQCHPDLLLTIYQTLFILLINLVLKYTHLTGNLPRIVSKLEDNPGI